MIGSRFRTALVGSDWDALWTGASVGIFAALPTVILFGIYNWMYLIDAFYAFTFAVISWTVVISVARRGGGVIAISMALFPLVGVVALIYGAPGVGILIVVALVLGSLVYLLYTLVGALLERYFRPLERESTLFGSDASSSDRRGSKQFDGNVGNDRESKGDRSPIVSRRTLLLAAGASAGSAIFGHVYGWWCKTSPADCQVTCDPPGIATVRITVSRMGVVVFRAERRIRAKEYFESAIPIGCPPFDGITVRVDVEGERSVTDTVTSPATDPPADRVTGSTLRINVKDDDVDIELYYLYTVH